MAVSHWSFRMTKTGILDSVQDSSEILKTLSRKLLEQATKKKFQNLKKKTVNLSLFAFFNV
jgi:ribonuclease I